MLLTFTKNQIKSNELNKINRPTRLRNLNSETFGIVTLYFKNSGKNNIININDVQKENLIFNLKTDGSLTDISNELNEEQLVSSGQNDSTNTEYSIKVISCTLTNANDEIVIEFKTKPTSLKGLFAYSNADKITLEKLQIENVKTMEFMFLNCEKLTQLEFADLNTSNIINMYGMFQNCYYLTKLEVSNWDTSKVENMSHMFFHCRLLNELDVSKWDTSNVNDMSYMFYNCQKLNQLDVNDWRVLKVKKMNNMFLNCFTLSHLIISNWDTSNVNDMSYMFYNCEKLTQLDVSKWDTSNVNDMSYMFYNCQKLTQVDVPKWDTSKVTKMGKMFQECQTISQLEVSKWDTSNVDDMSYMLYNCQSLTLLNVYNWDTSKITTMEYMFYNCQSITILNISNWDTSKVENMNKMFQDCQKLSKLDVSKWDTSSVTTMSFMFMNCQSLNILDLSKWDISNVNDISYMFYNCQKLTELNVYNWDTSKITTMDSMFMNCKNLVILNISKWDTSNVQNMDSMFMNCRDLKDLNIESFIQSHINYQSAKYFLFNDNNLEYCRYSGNVTKDNTKYFLRNCSKLIGFKKCYNCNNNSNGEYCEITLEVNDGSGSDSSMSITKVFHYLEEEKSLNEKSCYWIAGLESLSYFNKSLVDKYHYIKCDDSCNSCEFESKMCIMCNTGYYSLFNESSKKRKYCYNESTIDKHFYLYNLSEYRECHSECKTCNQGPSETSLNCLTYNDSKITLNKNNTKVVSTLIKKSLNYTYDELKKNILFDILLNYSNTYYNNSAFVLQLTNENMTLSLYNVGIDNMNNSYKDQLNLGIFNVNLSNCYEKIIKNYNINEDLVYAQMDYSNKVNFLIYYPKIGDIINMSICENMDIIISKNVELNKEIRNVINNAKEQGYNIIDKNDQFYNDVCTPYTTVNKTDITISDRITDIYKENFGMFESYNNCEFEFFNISETNATVKCNSKVKTSFFDEIKEFSLDTKQLLSNFKFCESSNFYVITCYKRFLSKEGQSNNFGTYIYYTIFGLTIVLIIVNRINGIKYLEDIFSEIIIEKKFKDIGNQKSMKKQKNIENSKKIDFISSSNKNNFFLPKTKNQLSNTKELIISIKEENKLNPPIKKRSSMKKKSIILKKDNNKSRNSKMILVKDSKTGARSIGDEQNKVNNENIPLDVISIEEDEKKNKYQKNVKEKGEKNNIEQKIEKQSIKKTKNTNEIDFNEFNFDKALKYDKRTFIQLYLSYFRHKHPILYLFYNDYNITVIKYILFLQSIGIHLCTNGLFFREGTMHHIYKDYGLFNFIYRLPFTLYSVIISFVVTFLFKRLALTQDCVIQYKNEVEKIENRNEAVKRASDIIKRYKIKLIFFVISIILILVMFWFYIGCFCAVYRNTQFYLLKDSAIGFGISMFYPIGIFLAAVLLRIIALKKNYPIIYRISKILA